MKLEKECRLCANYNTRKNGVAAYFKCDQGYFNYKLRRQPFSKKTSKEKLSNNHSYGYKPFKGILNKENIPCNGKEFIIYGSPKNLDLINDILSH